MNNIPKRVTSYFLAHGSPMMALQQNEYTAFLRSLGQNKPKAIAIFTAHWESRVTAISSVSGVYDMIYDFYGFPRALYEVKYPAQGSPEVAERIQQVLDKKGIKSRLDTKRGLDHGSWSLLYKIFPEADVPVVQLSVNPNLNAKGQIEIGQALRDLEDDIMVIGSGVTVHNSEKNNPHAKEPSEWAVEFDNWLIEKALLRDYEAFFNYTSLAPYAQDAVPTPEHFVPFLIALGCSDPSKRLEVLFQGYTSGAASYLCCKFS